MFESWDKLPFASTVCRSQSTFTFRSQTETQAPSGWHSATWPPWASEASPRGSRSMPQP
jgi:hypothetical protein